MTLGQHSLKEILEKLAIEGREPSPEELTQLESLSKEIDELYEIILQNQDAMGEPMFIIPESRDIQTYDPKGD